MAAAEKTLTSILEELKQIRRLLAIDAAKMRILHGIRRYAFFGAITLPAVRIYKNDGHTVVVTLASGLLGEPGQSVGILIGISGSAAPTSIMMKVAMQPLQLLLQGNEELWASSAILTSLVLIVTEPYDASDVSDLKSMSSQGAK